MMPMKLIRVVGRQQDGVYVMNDTIYIDSQGNLIQKEKSNHVWDSSLGDGNMPMAARILTPLKITGGRDYFQMCEEVVLEETFLNMMLIAG